MILNKYNEYMSHIKVDGDMRERLMRGVRNAKSSDRVPGMTAATHPLRITATAAAAIIVLVGAVAIYAGVSRKSGGRAMSEAEVFNALPADSGADGMTAEETTVAAICGEEDFDSDAAEAEYAAAGTAAEDEDVSQSSSPGLSFDYEEQSSSTDKDGTARYVFTDSAGNFLDVYASDKSITDRYITADEMNGLGKSDCTSEGGVSFCMFAKGDDIPEGTCNCAFWEKDGRYYYAEVSVPVDEASWGVIVDEEFG